MGRGGGAARLPLLLYFSCSADHERDRPPCTKVFFSGWLSIRSTSETNNNNSNNSNLCSTLIVVVVVVVVDSHLQRIVLATEETTVTQQVSHRPIKCQSRLWPQRGTKDNGSHHGDNPLLRPIGIQIATKSYAALQAMAPTNIKMVHQTSLLHIESNLDRLGMLSPTYDQRSQLKTGNNTLQPVSINKFKFLKATHCTEIRKMEISRSMVVEVLSWWSRRARQHPAVQSPVHL